jgi:D-alanine-D-alanine ligase
MGAPPASAGAGEESNGPASGGAAFITFDDKWGASFENRWFLVDAVAEESLVARLMAQSVKLYEAFEGEGLCRFDIRLDGATGQLMVLDANPNCSVFYKDECTADSIMRLVDGWSKARFMRFLLDHALERQRKFHRAHAYAVKYSEEKGFSLHAARDLAAGDLIYSDEEAPLRLVTRSYASAHWSAADMASFDAYAWPVGAGVFAIWDADSSKWKPINHSCDPSAWMSGLAVVARRPLARDDELTLDYATFEPSHPSFECWCGAAVCRRMIRPNEYREAWFQERYGAHVSPHIRALQEQEQREHETERRHKEELDKVRAGQM